jgi:hypothetical protein
MKHFAVVGGLCAAFLFSGATLVLAQDDHPREERKEEEKKQEEKKDVRQEERHDEHKAAERRRIDDAHFRAHFGREHHFAVRHVEIVEGRPRFAYGGYNFALVQAWPVGWAYTDDVYIDFIDGEYYLFNLRHPGVRIAVTVL